MKKIGNSEGYPTLWANYCYELLGNQDIDKKEFGFVGSNGDINRFAARFRAANCFTQVDFEGYSNATITGYSALFRVMLTWSTFEMFTNVTGLYQNDLRKRLEKVGAKDILTHIRELDKEARFYRFIRDHVSDKRHKAELDNYFNQDPCNITYLASSIRHIFAHGVLTPNSNKVSPHRVRKICDILCQFLLTFMDKEFSKNIERAVNTISHRKVG